MSIQQMQTSFERLAIARQLPVEPCTYDRHGEKTYLNNHTAQAWLWFKAGAFASGNMPGLGVSATTGVLCGDWELEPTEDDAPPGTLFDFTRHI